MIIAPLETPSVFEHPSLLAGDISFPLSDVSLDVEVSGLLVKADLVQVFENVYDKTLEVTYTFPLPASYAVRKMRALLGGRKVKAELRERTQARQMYDDAIRAGQRAVLAQEERSEVFTINLGNIAPGEKAEIRLSLTGSLEVAHSQALFRFPMVVSERYTPHSEKASPGLEAINPPRLDPLSARPSFHLNMTFESAGLKVGQALSSLHLLGFNGTDDSWKASFREPERLDRDICVRIPLLSKKPSVTLTVTPDGKKGGTWTLEVLAPKTAQKPKQVQVVLDRSGSMSSWKMRAAIRSAQALVSSLNESDSFNIIIFDSSHESWRQSLVPADRENRFKANRWLESVTPRGGTEMLSPIKKALEDLQNEVNPSIFFITDGQVGNENELIGTVKNSSGAVRLFSLGIGQAANMGFLERLSSASNALSYVVESEERVLDAAKDIARLVASPSLEGVSLAQAPFEIVEGMTSPVFFTDAFAGVPLTIAGRFKGPWKGMATVEALREGSLESFTVEVIKRANNARPSLWARSLIRALEDENASNPKDELKEKIVKLSLKYKVLSHFTAFIAVDNEKQDVGATLEVHQPVEPTFPSLTFNSLATPRGLYAASAAPASMGSHYAGSSASTFGDGYVQGASWSSVLQFAPEPLISSTDSGLATFKDANTSLRGFSSKVTLKDLLLGLRVALESQETITLKTMEELKSFNANAAVALLLAHLESYRSGSDNDRLRALEIVEELLKTF